ncbi:MAG: serine/threonine protein kinase, partial [Myxococcales bacterium]|nr:serine/threonine protein kinase [Myxococcales bacterium]
MVRRVVDADLPAFPGWTVLEQLGRGGMCAVYRAHRTGQPDDQHAIKVLEDLHDGARDRFLDEGRMLMELRHPNLLRVEEVVDADPPWLVMELLAGRDLEVIRDSGEAFAPEQVARWIADVAQGLQLAHDAGIVHRDLKPSNLMLGTHGEALVMDWGLARRVGADF